jgi:hypothetical protein
MFAEEPVLFTLPRVRPVRRRREKAQLIPRRLEVLGLVAARWAIQPTLRALHWSRKAAEGYRLGLVRLFGGPGRAIRGGLAALESGSWSGLAALESGSFPTG